MAQEKQAFLIQLEGSLCPRRKPHFKRGLWFPMSPGRLLGHPSAAPLPRTCSRSRVPPNPLPRPAPTGYLHVFPQRAGVGVRFVTHFAQVGFVRSVDVHVLLPVAAVGKAPVTAFELTLEGLFPCKKEGQRARGK